MESSVVQVCLEEWNVNPERAAFLRRDLFVIAIVKVVVAEGAGPIG